MSWCRKHISVQRSRQYCTEHTTTSLGIYERNVYSEVMQSDLLNVVAWRTTPNQSA